MDATEDAPPPEGTLIEEARKSAGLSQNAAAKAAGMSGTRWRQIVRGIASTSGTKVKVVPPVGTLARMARVVDLSPEDLAKAGREDAADELRTLASAPPRDAGDDRMMGRVEGEPPLRDGEILEWREGTAGHLRYTLTRTDPWARYGAEFTPDTDLESVVAALRQVIDIADVTGLGQKTR